MSAESETVSCEACHGTGERAVRIDRHSLHWCSVGRHESCIGEIEDWQAGFLLRVRRCDCECHG